jgi:DNA-directed RNA polymerase subunit H (RpoH/RPB5)
MKKAFFKTLNKINKWFLPKLSKKDPAQLSKFEQAIVAYRYYVLIQSLD